MTTSIRSIEASCIAAARGGRMLFRDLSFRIEAGGALSVEGPNGAGKTSLLRLIAGFLAPLDGRILVRAGGADIEDAEERGKFVGWLGHADAIKPQMRVRETLAFYAGLYRSRAMVDAAMDAVGLAPLADLPGQYLSAGQRKRVALARLWLCGRPLWLIDEPLASLDASGKRIAAKMIAEHCEGGGIALVATHETLGLDCARLTL